MPRLTFPAKAKVFAIWVRRRRGATLLAHIIILTIICAFQNRYFGLAHPICRIPATSAGEVARFNNMRALKASRNEGRALHSQKIAAVSSARFSRAEYLLAQAKSHFCVSALNLPIPRLTEGVKATRIFTVCSEKARR